jgi:hypothetical protein
MIVYHHIFSALKSRPPKHTTCLGSKKLSHIGSISLVTNLSRVLVFIPFPSLGEGALSSSNANVKFVLIRLEIHAAGYFHAPLRYFRAAVQLDRGSVPPLQAPHYSARGAVIWNQRRGAVIRNRLICMNILEATATVTRLAPLSTCKSQHPIKNCALTRG